MVVLDRRIDRFGRDPDPLADVQVDALGLLLGRGDPDERQRVGVEAIGRQARIAGAARRHAAGADHRHVGIVEAAGAHAAVQDLPHLGAAVGDLHAQLVEAGEEPVEVVVETEERALPGADDVVGDVGAGEAPVEHRDLGLRQRLPVAVDEHRSALELAPRHRSHAVPSSCSRRAIAIGAAAVSIRRSARARRRPIARVALRCRPHQELRCSKPEAFANRTAAAPSSPTCRSTVAGRRDRRPARAERRRQVDHRRDALRPGRRRRRRGVRRRGRRAPAADRAQPGAAAADRRRAAGALDLREPRRRGQPGAVRRALRPRRRAAAPSAWPRRWRWSASPTAAKDKPSTFSGGMKRRLNIAAALVHDPDILIFDEPTVGVDPQSRNAIFDNLEDAAPARQGAALHHPLHGRGRAPLRPHRHHRPRQGRRQRHPRRHRASCCRRRRCSRSRSTALVDLTALRRAARHRRRRRRTGELLRAGVADLGRNAPALLAAGSRRRPRRAAASPRRRAGLEDVFLSLTGRQLRD